MICILLSKPYIVIAISIFLSLYELIVYYTHFSGHSITDEMCILYLMYYSKEVDDINNRCFGKDQKATGTIDPSKMEKRLSKKNLPKEFTTKISSSTNLLSIFKNLISVI